MVKHEVAAVFEKEEDACDIFIEYSKSTEFEDSIRRAKYLSIWNIHEFTVKRTLPPSLLGGLTGFNLIDPRLSFCTLLEYPVQCYQ